MSKQTAPIQLHERESSIEKYLVRRCANLGWECWKLTCPGRRGVPDRLVIGNNGMLAFIELKKHKGPVQALQTRTMNNLSKRNQESYILESREEIDSCLDFLKQLDEL